MIVSSPTIRRASIKMSFKTAIQTARSTRGVLMAFALATVLSAATASAAGAASPDVRLYTEVPDTAAPGATLEMPIVVRNAGDAIATGEITVTQTASDGMTFESLSPFGDPGLSSHVSGYTDHGMLSGVDCTTVGQTTSCQSTVELYPGAQYFYRTRWAVDPGASGTIDYDVSVDGAGVVDTPGIERDIAVGPPPPFGIADAFTRFIAPDGSPARQAGSTPWDTVTALRFASYATAFIGVLPLSAQPEHPKDITVQVPAGLLANPQAADRCSVRDLVAGGACPPNSAIGTFFAFIGSTGNLVPLFNLEAPPGAPAAFGANLYGTPVMLVARLRDTDYGADIVSLNTSTTLQLSSVEVTLWGNPASERHDSMRADCIGHPGYLGGLGELCPSEADEQAFMRLPTSCTGDLLGFDASTNSYENLGVFSQRSFDAPSLTGCADVPFDPALSVVPTSGVPGSPTGLDVVLSVPQDSNPDSLAQADLRKAKVVLPEGMSINPASAHGLQACSDDQLRKGLPGAAQCPDGSKIGTVSVKSPLLDHPLDGSVVVRSQNSGDPGSGEMFRIAVTVDSDADGIHLKLPGSVAADPQTGRLTTTFDNNPQLPFSEFRLHFKGGQRAPLVNPPSCGVQQVGAELTGWNGALRMPPASFELNGGCQAPGFDPGFEAGSVNPVAGRFSPFVARFTRPDRDRELARLDVALPKGVLADLSKIDLCSNAQIAGATGRSGMAAQGSPGCPSGSQIGTTTVGAGAGSDPFFPALPGTNVSGRVFLTEAYTATSYGPPGAKPVYGLAIEVPAVAGPYDLGNVIVRAAMFVDPVTAQVSVVSDPLPLVVKGVRLFVQDVRVNVDRSGFTLNPTSCAPKLITAAISSVTGAVATPAVPFQVGDCAALNLAPKLAIALTGKGQTTDNKHPGVHATVSQPAGQANLKKVVVSLPLSLALDPDNAQALCEFTDGSKVDPTCPKGSIVGKAVARTPILNQPLTGPVYFVKNIRKDPKSGREIRTLPKLVIPLTGENGLRLNLVGTSNVVDNHLVTTFDNIPDAPVSNFTLDIDGGKSGILVVSGTDICKASQVAEQQIDGQNGKNADTDIYLQTPACSLKVLSKKVGKTSVAIKIGGLSAGKVTVTGKGIRKTTKTISKSTVATITAKRTKGKPGKVKVSFDPAGPAKARKTTK